ncbi:MAG: amino acid ABC transporter permease [Dehalococcoidia bacterium]
MDALAPLLQLDFRPDLIREYLFNDVIVDGAWITLQVAVLAQLLGIFLGGLFALLRISRNPVLGVISGFYVWFFRGTPALLQLIILYIGLPTVIDDPSFTQELTAFRAAIIAFGINEGAYMTEIMRAGIVSVEHGQMDAARSLGMTQLQGMRRIVLPQAMRVVVPPTGNEFIAMLKNSSLAFTIGLVDLLGASRLIYSVNFRPMELLVVAAIWYLAMTTVFSLLQAELERVLAVGDRDRPQTLLSRAMDLMGQRHAR